MIRAALPLFAVLPLLAACGDDPENVPLYGQWELTRTLDSVTIDGMLLTPDQLPPEFRAMEGTEARCGEPLYTDADWQARDVSQRTGRQCELESYSHDERGAELGGSCSLSEGGASYRPTMRGRSTFDETSTRDVITMEGSLKLPGDNSPHVLKLIAVQEGKRIGDC